jgi:protein-tyrosine phosphatase
MVRGLAALGFDVICATPHQKAGQFLPTLEAIRGAFADLQQQDLGVALTLAAENMWDDVFFERFEANAIPSYGDGPAFLVEFRLSALPVGLMQHVFTLRMKGKLPVIAHPERYEPLYGARDLVAQLRAECAMVVDLGALAGYHGRKRGKVARAMVKEGIAHAAASDAHTLADVRAAAEGIEWIRKKVGEAAVQRLLVDNPRRIIAGEHPEG